MRATYAIRRTLILCCFILCSVVPAALAGKGAYSIDFSAATPPLYYKVFPGFFPCPVDPTDPADSGRADNPLTGATFLDNVESLSPRDLALGQIVAFEIKIDVNGSTMPEDGRIAFTAGWNTILTSGDDFGYDDTYRVYCAFIDTGDSFHQDPDGDATLQFSSALTVDEIIGTFELEGLDDGDTVIVEVWLVLDDAVPASVTGNVQSRLIDAWTLYGDAISTGNQTVPLMKVKDFFSATADLGLGKSDSMDPVTIDDQFTYYIGVTNFSDNTVANGVVVTDTLDSATAFISVEIDDTTLFPRTCTNVGDLVICDLMAMVPGETLTIAITVDVLETAPTTGTGGDGPCTGSEDLRNEVTLSALTGDGEPGNNADCEPTGVITYLFLTCPDDLILECDEPTGTNSTGSAVTSGNCPGSVQVTYHDVTEAGDQDCANAYRILRIWTASDACDNMVTCTQTLAVADTTAPVLAGVPDDDTVECDAVPEPALVTATDNCDADPVVTFAEVFQPGVCAADYRLLRTWTAEDACGNTSTATQIVTVVDTTAPVIACPADVTIECDEDSSPAATGEATATDNCDADVSVTFSDSVAPGNCPQQSVITRTWTATDDCGNSASCDQVITVVDTTAPVIACPADVTIECDEDSSPAGTGEATAVDNCDADLAVSFSDNVAPGSCPQQSIITRTWITIDDCGNQSSCDQVITVVDTTAPVITCPADATIECDEDSSPAGTGEATAVDNCDADATVTFSDSVAPGSCPQQSIITRTWTVIDDCGNIASCDQVITIVDTTAPVINCPADVTVECDADSSPAATGEATATDNCDADVSVTFSDGVAPGNCPRQSIVTRTWTAIDDCGNSTSCDQVITVVDTTAPVIVCPADVTIECDEDSSPAGTGEATAVDNCDGDAAVSFSDNVAAGGCPEQSIITRTWTAIDDCGNQSTCDQLITVVDTTAPVITCPADVTIECDEDSSPAGTGEATAVDNCDGEAAVSFSDNVAAGSCPEQSIITRTWTAIDDCGNSASCDQVITVVDITAPALVPPLDITVECDQPTAPGDTGRAEATDNCDPAPQVTFADVVTPGACAGQFTIFRTWTATDACGNAAEYVQTIQVVDTTPPELVVPPRGPIECDDSSDPSATGVATATDNCDSDPAITYVDEILAGTCPQNHFIRRIWTAEDACGNSASRAQIIGVWDRTPPELITPPDATIECSESIAPDALGSATATDNCDSDPHVAYEDRVEPGDCADRSVIVRTWTATDACGNMTGADQVITVIDTTPPDLTVPADLTVECDQSTDPLNTGEAQATDNCDAAPGISYADMVTPGDCPSAYVITRRWTAIDACGNASEADQRITVVDTTPPVFSSVAEQIQVECHEIPPLEEAIAVDNCSEPVIEFTEIPMGPCAGRITELTLLYLGSEPALVQIEQRLPGNNHSLIWDDVVEPGMEFTFFGSGDDGVMGSTLKVFVDGEGHPEIHTSCSTPIGPGLVIGVFEVIAGKSRDGGILCPIDDEACNSGCGTQLVRIWRAWDACGNTASVTQRVFIVDETPPVLTVPPRGPIECDEPSDPSATGYATAVDNCDAHPALTYRDEIIAGKCPQNYFIRRIWTAEDNCGNSASRAQLIGVWDRTAPVLVSPPDVTLACGEPTEPATTGQATALDACDVDPVVTYVDAVTSEDCENSRIITRTWTATDACGNIVTADQQIIVADITPPLLTVPPRGPIECDEPSDPSATGYATAVDDCDADPVLTYRDEIIAGACPQNYFIRRIWTAEDNCGNSASRAQIIGVWDRTAPVIDCPPALVLGSFDAVPAPDITDVIASDSCGTVLVEYGGDTPNGGTGVGDDPYIFLRAYAAVDECGNRSVCTQTIHVVTDESPVIVAAMDPVDGIMEIVVESTYLFPVGLEYSLDITASPPVWEPLAVDSNRVESNLHTFWCPGPAAGTDVLYIRATRNPVP